MRHNPGYRSIKTEAVIYSPLLIEVHCKDNSSSCPGFGGKKCVICGEIFYNNISTKEEIKHMDKHTDGEIAKVLTSHHCISELKTIKGDLVYDGRCWYGGCQRPSNYRIIVKERDDISPSYCCTLHIGNIIESNHLSNVKCVIEIIKSK